jgi:hypothetical protein
MENNMENTNSRSTVTLEVTIDELNIIVSGVAKLPIEMGLATFRKIDEQARQQLNPQNNQPAGPLASKVVN